MTIGLHARLPIAAGLDTGLHPVVTEKVRSARATADSDSARAHPNHLRTSESAHTA